ncbi:hypothetical protein TWF281_011180 [Arthrobotrys megalospora]
MMISKITFWRSLSVFVWLLVFCHTCAASEGKPINRLELDGGLIEEYDNGTYRINEHLWVYDCNNDQVRQLYEALDDSKKVLKEVKTPNLDRFSAQEYLGTQWRLEWQTYNTKILTVFSKAEEWASRWGLFYGPYVYCESEKRKCDLDDYRATPIKVEYPENDSSPGAQLTLVLCNRWFGAKSLTVVLEQAKFCQANYPQDNIQLRVLDMRWYENRAFWLIVTIFYIREVNAAMTADFNPHFGPNPPPAPNIFHVWPTHDCIWAKKNRSNRKIPTLAPWSAKKLATNPAHGEIISSGPLGNPTNYGLFSLAEYITKEIGDYPDRPYVYNSKHSWWAPRGERMCAGFDPHILAGDPDLKPNSSMMAVAPWVFSPQEIPKPPVSRRGLESISGLS